MFTNAYSKEVYKSEHIRNATKRLRIILYARYEKIYLHKFMETQCQHLTTTKRNEFLKLLEIFESLFYGTLGTWKTDPVDFGLKENEETICSRLYLVPKVHGEIFKKEVEGLVLL